MAHTILVDKKTIQIFAHFEKFFFTVFGQQVMPNPAFKKRAALAYHPSK